MITARLFLLLVGLASLAVGCLRNPPPTWLGQVPDTEAVGIFHRVQAGQTLAGICRAYKADLQEVAEVNGIDDPDSLREGLRLFIPDAQVVVDLAGSGGDPKDAKTEIRKSRGRFIWPVDGVVTSKYGIRHGRRHDGLDIGAPTGTPVRAAAAGKVLYVGQQRGYGKLVILSHAGNYITVYAHNHRNKVKEGADVKQGQVVAEVGQTGRATGPHLHFEIRVRTKPRNPLFFLPRPD